MGLADREYMRHPPKCACGECRGKKRKLAKRKAEEDAKVKRLLSMEYCPICKLYSLDWNPKTHCFECRTPECAGRFTKKELKELRPPEA